MDGLRVLGVDPGLNLTGYGVLIIEQRRVRLAEAGVVRGGSSHSQLGKRVRRIHEGIVDVIESCQPDVLALENLYSHYQRPNTAILMGHARGVICLAAAQKEIPVHGYAATQVKKILTGSGRAPKLQVQQAVQRELRLAELPDPPDVADALAIAMCHYYLGGTRSIA
ncbi:MAG: crossover junction endodeoxyribonuclease RuvC [Planctomycetaceae bacterium]|nr:crossover junction endodeoxyribonuclease RuvC [Planctomycetaceae bacterium]